MRARHIAVVTVVAALTLLGSGVIFGDGQALAKRDPILSQTCLNFLAANFFGVNFKCYTLANGENIAQGVTLVDQFDTEHVTVRQSQLVCTPADKSGVPDGVNGAFFEACPEFHLKCYNVVPTQPPLGEEVTLTDQFGIETGVMVQATQYLCEGATKSVD